MIFKKLISVISLICFFSQYSFGDEIKNRNNTIQKGDKITHEELEEKL